MTGFGSAQTSTSFGLIQVEIRSVNNRYFELSLRLPDDLRGLEPSMREKLIRVLPRGKVEVRMSLLRESPVASALVSPNFDRIDALLRLHDQLSRQYSQAIAPWSMADLLNFPGVLPITAPSNDSLPSDALMAVFDAAVQSLEDARQAEGFKLAQTITDRLDTLLALRTEALALLPEAVEGLRAKIQARLQEAFGQSLSPELQSDSMAAILAERIQQEAHAAAGRADIAEELDRLQVHIQAMAQSLEKSSDQPQGKRLDFLCQELHREANTLGAKSSHVRLTQISMEMRLTIEQIREQVQNVQ
jgi:uncharacterized protein (TIGR00255 family)